MRCLRLRKGTVGGLLYRVNKIGKLDRVLNEEDGDIVADNVPVAFPCIKLHRETPDITGKIDRALAARDGRKPHEGRSLLAATLEYIGRGEV